MAFGFGRLLCDQLDQVATRVIEDSDDGSADVSRGLRERDACGGQSTELNLDIVGAELSQGDAILSKGTAIRLYCRVNCWLEQELGAARRLR